MSSKASMVGAFIEDAPPGELSNVKDDIKALVPEDQGLFQQQAKAFQKYNEEQFVTVKLPGGSQEVLITPYNSLDDGQKYYDVESQISFSFDHVTQQASSPQSYSVESSNLDLLKSLQKSLITYTSEHFPDSTTGVYPTENDEKIAIVLVANKYSPHNFWNGRYRSSYILSSATTPPHTLTGKIDIDVHYYEDGNVRLTTSKPINITIQSNSTPSSSPATQIIRQISQIEKKYQEELNRAFGNLNEGAFKNLRRQLPVTRQKVEWERIGGYRLGQDIGGGRSGGR